MPMTAEEDLLSHMIGSKSHRPMVGMSRTKPCIAFTYGVGWYCLAEITGVPVLEISERKYGFDTASASWIPLRTGYAGGNAHRGWSDTDEAMLQRLRAF